MTKNGRRKKEEKIKLIKLKIFILTKLKKNQVLKKINFWQKVFWLEQLDTLTLDGIYLGQPFAISQFFIILYVLTTTRLVLTIKWFRTRANTAQIHSPLNPKLCLLLIQIVAKFCRHVCFCLLSLLSLLSLPSLLSLMSQLSRCQIYFHTALLQLQIIADLFVLVCKFETMSEWVTSRMGGVMTKARLTSGPW